MAGTAIIGLGMMGQGMARNILKAGIDLKGYDISAPARQRFSEAGGVAVESAKAAAEGCDLLLVMVQTALQVEAALFASGAVDALMPGSTVVLSSTIAPTDVRVFAQSLSAAGHVTLDAPVSGGQTGADAGALTIMAAGPDAAFTRAGELLAAISRKVHRVGSEPGMGATYKVVHQLAAGVHLVAAAELMSLGVSAGCDPKMLHEIVSSSSGQSWMFDDRVPRMMSADPSPTSTVDIFVKDVGLVLQTGRESNVPLPLAAAAHQMLIAAAGLGLGSEDDSMVVRVYEALTGKTVHES
ncbi:2-(hydroxymethyl)glutarate dehydrogenase [Defluviimonas aquaemixtae]|uniref:2-(Hydroxymethyl)glutarate dehydrogenase n=1 Tax=Albidovulum aquaemixtae TaxID=1542388 RepID=A0A2R8B3R4_9RHOB|nr:NAD(P)-binding domain-containing protein [Defluviimonas aquaemixtae]SPH17237.1 2-(hydroxymethyl)glutarate dehydrogenase [Defluviimonas aquaemixtae]